MKSVVLCFAVMTVAASASGAQRPAVPAMIASPDAASGPLWVSASSISGPDGQIDVSRVSGRARTTLESYTRRAPSADAVCFGGIVGAASAPSAAADRTVYSGTITAIENGFYLGNPGVLLQVRVDSRAGSAARPDDTLLIFYPRAEFSVGGQQFCAGSRGMHVANVGERAALILNRPLPAGAPFIYPADQELFFEDPSGAVVTRRGPAREADQFTFNEFVARATARERR